MIRVRALSTYKDKNIIDKQLRIIPAEGYEFEVSEERYEYLTKTNPKGLKFVEKVKKEKPVTNTQGSE